ncbi:MAG: hypothetical protein ACLGH6_13690 [Gammaproteobacteria bacterium]
MNAYPYSRHARIALLVAVASLTAGCAHVRDDYDPYPYDPYYHDGPRVTYYDYWYYPALGCYYDTRTRYYIYFESNRWARARVLPPHLRPHLGSHVVVRAPHERPYEYHQRHREQYAPERYRKPDVRGDDIWLGPPRREVPARDRDERRREYPERERNGYDLPRERKDERKDERNDYRGAVPRLQEPRVREPEPRAQKPNAQIKAAPERRPPPAVAAPLGRKSQEPAPAHRAVEQRGSVRGSDRSEDERRGNGRHEGNGEPPAANPGRGPERHPDDRYGRGGRVEENMPSR